MKSKEKFIDRKQELVTKITELITRDGFENITVRGICQEIGISTGSFYHYFSDKGDLIKVLFMDIDEYFLHQVSEKFTEDEVQNLVYFCECYGRYITKNGVETCRCISLAPLKIIDHHYLKSDRYIFTVLHGIVERGSIKGQFQLSLTSLEITRMILILLRGYSSDWAKQNGSYDLVEALHTFITVFIKSLK